MKNARLVGYAAEMPKSGALFEHWRSQDSNVPGPLWQASPDHLMVKTERGPVWKETRWAGPEEQHLLTSTCRPDKCTSIHKLTSTHTHKVLFCPRVLPRTLRQNPLRAGAVGVGPPGRHPHLSKPLSPHLSFISPIMCASSTPQTPLLQHNMPV